MGCSLLGDRDVVYDVVRGVVVLWCWYCGVLKWDGVFSLDVVYGVVRGVVVLWYCGVVVLWCCGVVVLWYCGVVVVVLWL